MKDHLRRVLSNNLSRAVSKSGSQFNPHRTFGSSMLSQSPRIPGSRTDKAVNGFLNRPGRQFSTDSDSKAEQDAGGTYETKRGLFPPEDAKEEFLKTGVAQEYYSDIFHSAFTDDIENFAKQKSISSFDAGAGGGNGLDQLHDYFSNQHGKDYYGMGINYPDPSPLIPESSSSGHSVESLMEKNIDIIQDDLSDLNNSQYSYDHWADMFKKGEDRPELHKLSTNKGQFDLMTDAVGALSYTPNASGNLQNSLEMLRKGGVAHINLSWKMLMRDTLPAYHNWSSNQDTQREKHRTKENFGFSLLIDPGQKSKKQTDHKDSGKALMELVSWLASIENFDMSIETTTDLHAYVVNNALKKVGLKPTARVNPKYKEWQERYGLQNARATQYRDSTSLFKNMGLNVDPDASVKGVRTTQDTSGQRYFEMIANENSNEISAEINSDNRKDAMDYISGNNVKSMSKSGGSKKLADAIYSKQQHYGAFLFIRMKRKNLNSVEVPGLEGTYQDTGRPDFRTYEPKPR